MNMRLNFALEIDLQIVKPLNLNKLYALIWDPLLYIYFDDDSIVLVIIFILNSNWKIFS
jgi:hypothetical protein